MRRIFTDQLNRTVDITFPPKRIISLVPSQTELLHALGLEEAVAGITKFCVHPERWRKEKQIVGGTKQFHHDRIDELKPDLIIANKEENTRADIEQLSKRYPVWISDVQTLEDALEMIRQLGRITDSEKQSKALAMEIQETFSNLPAFEIRKVAYLIWRKPFMVAASNTFIHEMLQRAGLENVFGHLERYPEVSLESIVAQKPDALLLSSEPYPFKEKHLEEFQEACPRATITLVDGELFSWYGSRLKLSPAYFRELRKSI